MHDKKISWAAGFAEGDQFMDYWASLPKSPKSHVPLKSDFNPARITSILPHVFVAERTSPDQYIMRLRGTWLEKFVGPIDTEQNVYDSYTGQARADYVNFINTVMNTPCAGVCDRVFISERDHKHPFPTLFAPFADDKGDPRFMIGVALMSGYKSWEISDMDSIYARTIFRAFRYIDCGFGVPDPIS